MLGDGSLPTAWKMKSEEGCMNLAKKEAVITRYSLIQGIESLIRRIWFLPADAEEREIENYATEVLNCVTMGDNINTLELFLGQIQTNRLQQPYTLTATRDLAERAFALITSATSITASNAAFVAPVNPRFRI
jgi:hypothetical protein